MDSNFGKGSEAAFIGVVLMLLFGVVFFGYLFYIYK